MKDKRATPPDESRTTEDFGPFTSHDSDFSVRDAAGGRGGLDPDEYIGPPGGFPTE